MRFKVVNLFWLLISLATMRHIDGNLSIIPNLKAPQPNPPHRSADARMNGQYLYEIWPNATSSEVGGMYGDATKLSDYSSIPSAWK